MVDPVSVDPVVIFTGGPSRWKDVALFDKGALIEPPANWDRELFIAAYLSSPVARE